MIRRISHRSNTTAQPVTNNQITEEPKRKEEVKKEVKKEVTIVKNMKKTETKNEPVVRTVRRNNNDNTINFSGRMESVIRTNSRKTKKFRPNRRRITNTGTLVFAIDENKIMENENNSKKMQPVIVEQKETKRVVKRVVEKVVESSESEEEEVVVVKRKQKMPKKIESDSDSELELESEEEPKKVVVQGKPKKVVQVLESEEPEENKDLYKIKSNTSVSGKPVLIKNIELLPSESGIEAVVEINCDALVHACYTINYKIAREYMLGTISKVDKKTTIRKVIDKARITGKEITFGVVDIYSEKEPLWIQKIEITLL